MPVEGVRVVANVLVVVVAGRALAADLVAPVLNFLRRTE
jgi:hypothetical protein